MKGTLKGLIVIVAVILIAAIWKSFFTDGSLEDKSFKRREIATRVLAEYLIENIPDSKVMVLTNPFVHTKGRASEIYKFEEAGIRGIEKNSAINKEAVVLESPELTPEAINDPTAVLLPFATSTPLSFLTAENAWDSLIEKHSEVNAIISLIGLPSNLMQTRFWNDPDGPKVAAIFPDFRVLGGRDAVSAAFQSERFFAAVIEKSDAPSEDLPLMDDYKAEFDARFVLVTKNNFADNLWP